MYKMQCFRLEPHKQHQWTFYYINPPTVYICPGFDCLFERADSDYSKEAGL